MRRRRGVIRGLIVRWPYVEMLANGTKKWELRKCNTKFRGVVALVSRGMLYGFAELTASFKMNVAKLKRYEHMHRASDILDYYAGGRDSLYVWVFKHPIKLPSPIKVRYPRGAMIWVYLNEKQVLKAMKERGYERQIRDLLRLQKKHRRSNLG